jgi:DNA-binding transcriptional MerR regulator
MSDEANHTNPARKGLKIGQVAKATGATQPTIRHYAELGLIPKPRKTGKTMAYYDTACVERIKLIKKLQTEQFLPLEIIKRLIDSGQIEEQEVRIGRAMAKTDKLNLSTGPVDEDDIEKASGLERGVINRLEKEELIKPVQEGGRKVYHGFDCRVLDLVRRRNDLGLPLDFTIDLMKIYGSSVSTAVDQGMERFVKTLLDQRLTADALSTIREGDESMDQYMVLVRQHLLGERSRRAIDHANRLALLPDMLNILPVPGRDLPKSMPSDPNWRFVIQFLRGDYASIREGLGRVSRKSPPWRQACAVLANLLAGDYQEAAGITEALKPRGTDPLLNSTAAMAHAVLAGHATGFTRPAASIGKALQWLARVRESKADMNLELFMADYIRGSILLALPVPFGVKGEGLDILKHLDKSLRRSTLKIGRGPVWWSRTLKHEIFPEVLIRINRLLTDFS